MSRPASRFIGRRAELDQLAALFGGGQRLITLWGPGGTGKTRLAVEYAAAQSLPWLFCDLSETRSVDQVAAALIRVLQLDPSTTADLLGVALARKGPLLLILDNFEQVLEAAASSVARWSSAATDARLLVTSRERLRLVNEHAIEIGPLPLPAVADEAASSDAVLLFVDRVRAVRPDFSVTKENAEVLTSAVAQLEGLPLAIELAAARFDVLGLDGLSARLAAQPKYLTRAPRDAVGRHATLRSAIEWSWALLDERQKSVLMQCSIFRGGFSLEAAEAVISCDGELLDVLQDLRDKSLLRAAPGDGARFGLLESIRQWSEEKLSASELFAEVSQRHNRYFLKAGSSWAAATPRPDLTRLLLELENLSAVLERSLAGGAHDDALTAALALDPVYASRGPYAVYLSILDRVWSEAGSAAPLLRARLLRARGKTRQMLGVFEDARLDYEAALAIARSSGATLEEAGFCNDLGVLHHQRRDFESARAAYRRALEISSASGHRREIGRALGNLGAIHHDRREYSEALEHYRQALIIHREVGDRRLEGIFSTNLGILEHERGQLHAAMDCYRAALDLLSRAGDRRLEAITWANQGMLLMELGRLEEARLAQRRAAEIGDELGDQRTRALGHARLGAVASMLGDIDDARRSLTSAEDLAGHPPDPLALEVIALSRGFLEAALARRAFAANHAEEATAFAFTARTRIDRAKAASGAEKPLFDRSDDARLLIRLLEQTLSAIGGAAPSSAESAMLLLVSPGARWFQPPSDEWIDFRRRKPLRLILLKLIEHRLEAPGRGLSLETLIEAGWPGETIQTEAANNRMYVALATLRKLGLKDLLRSSDEGYLLDPEVGVRWVRREAGDEEGN